MQMEKTHSALIAIMTTLSPSLIMFLVMTVENGDQPGLKKD